MYGRNATMTDDYKPVDCAQHSEYEAAILQHRRLRIGWREAGGQSCIDTITPLDLVTRDHAEFLVATRSDGGRLELRLDRIKRSESI